MQAEILNLFRELHQSQGLTYILVSHDLSVISHLCNRLAVMNNGKLLEQLDIKDLTGNTPKHAYTQELFNASVGYTERLSESAGRLKEGHD